MEISHAFRSRKGAAAGLLSLCNHGVFLASLRLRRGHCGCPIAKSKCHVKQQSLFKWTFNLGGSHFAVVFSVYFLRIKTYQRQTLLYSSFLSQDWGQLARQSWREDNYIELQLKTLTAHQELPLTRATDMLLATRRAPQRLCSLRSHQLSPWLRLARLPQPDGKQ